MIQKINKNKILLILTAIVILAIVIDTSFVKHNEKNSTFIIEKVSKICELSTTTYRYSNIISFKENKKFQDIKIPFTQKSFLIKYEGIIKAGIDIKKIKIIKNNKQSIRIRLNKSKITQHFIDEKKIYVYDEKTSLFNKLMIKDVLNEISNEKEQVEKNLIEEGFLEEANKNAKIFLESFLKDLGYKNIEINFE